MALAAVTLLAGCGGGAAPSAPSKPAPAPSSASKPAPVAARKLTPISVEMAWIPIGNQLPFYLAQERGYYTAEGLKVKIVGGRGSSLTAQQVANGKYDLGQTDLNSMALARAKGAAVESVMVEFPKSPFGLFGAKDKGIKTWKDLYGKSVTVSAGSPETFLLPATFKKLGLDLARVHEINTGPAAKTADYLSGKADAVGTDLASLIPLVDAKRPSYNLWFGDVLPVPYLGVFGRTAYIKAHPTVVRGFVAATLKAMKALNTDPKSVQEAANAMVAANPGRSLKTGVFVASWKIYKNFLVSPETKGHPLGWQSAAQWRATLTILHDYAGLKGDMNPQDYFTNSFIPAS